MAKKKRQPEPPPLRLEWRSPAELADNPRNWRRHPEPQLAALSDVIGEVGWAGACLYNERTGRLIDGHARRKVAMAQGCERVPVLVGNWSEADEAKILATLDPLAAMAEADEVALAALLRGVASDSPAVTQLLESLAEEAPADVADPSGGGDDFDAAPEAGPTRTAVGELWVIGGKHRLLVGDCTVAENVGRLMGAAKVGLCFTSPPYAQQRDYGAKIADWDALMRGAFATLPMADDGQVLVNLGLVHRDGEWLPYWDGWIGWMREQGWRRFGWYVWDQGPGLPGDWAGRLSPSHEFVFHFNRAARKPAKTEPCKHAGEVQSSRTFRNTDGSLDGFTHTGRAVQSHRIADSVIRVTRQHGAGIHSEHPAVYPVGLAAVGVECWPGDVYDPFLGSGTTMVAAHRLGRVCYGCELEPRYADVILRRAEAEGLSCEKAETVPPVPPVK